jgi:hypothetical protein
LIGVISCDHEKRIVEEFFQLFKTPWEFYAPDGNYDVVLSTKNEIPRANSKLTIIYGSDITHFNLGEKIDIQSKYRKASVEYKGVEIPIYGKLLTFEGTGEPILKLKDGSEIAGVKLGNSEIKIILLGYNLFEEIYFLLSVGQPRENALIPTLDIHISILRNLIIDAGIPLIEIPPIPAGYDFIASLTHDVDFVGIRKHKFDHTMWGFLYRGSIGSFFSFLKGRYSLSRLVRNWKAVLSLPAIYLGLCKDFWLEFDSYLAIEKDLKSTFFLIPFKNVVGEKISRRNSKWRAARYDITDVEEWAKKLINLGYEIGLHGIDAWHSYEKGCQELKRISEVTKKSEIGVRMHWLCFEEHSPEILEEAGFSYDSTMGYNETIGYLAGTTQVFRPLSVRNILELPLHIQDTSLLNSRKLRLTEEQAWRVCVDFINRLSLHGGVLTILWHMRSLAPERLWDEFYVRLLEELKKRHAWITSAERVVAWFLKRRELSFEDVCFTGDKLVLSLKFDGNISDPDFILRVHLPELEGRGTQNHIDIPLSGKRELEIPL